VDYGAVVTVHLQMKQNCADEFEKAVFNTLRGALKNLSDC